MGSSRETFTGKRLEPTRALILGMAGSSSVAQQGGRRLPLRRLLLGKKPGVPKPHPEAICTPGPEPRSLCAAAASAAAPRWARSRRGSAGLFVSAAGWERWCVRRQRQALAGFPAAAGAASSQG